MAAGATGGPDGGGWLACNVSSSSLEDPSFPRQVERLLREHDGDPGRLVLQIGERAVMSDPRGAVEVLDALRSLGLRVAIAEFRHRATRRSPTWSGSRPTFSRSTACSWSGSGGIRTRSGWWRA